MRRDKYLLSWGLCNSVTAPVHRHPDSIPHRTATGPGREGPPCTPLLLVRPHPPRDMGAPVVPRGPPRWGSGDRSAGSCLWWVGVCPCPPQTVPHPRLCGSPLGLPSSSRPVHVAFSPGSFPPRPPICCLPRRRRERLRPWPRLPRGSRASPFSCPVPAGSCSFRCVAGPELSPPSEIPATEPSRRAWGSLVNRSRSV